MVGECGRPHGNWSRHGRSECKRSAASSESPVRFALALSLEVAAGPNIDIHEQVRLGLRTQVRERARVQLAE